MCLPGSLDLHSSTYRGNIILYLAQSSVVNKITAPVNLMVYRYRYPVVFLTASAFTVPLYNTIFGKLYKLTNANIV
jgi:hypothetical protein